MTVTPAGTPEATLAIAGNRAGALGVLNLEFAHDQAAAMSELDRLVAHARGPVGALVDGEADALLSAILDRPGVDTLILTASRPDRLADMVERIHAGGRRAFLVVTSAAEAEAGRSVGVDALIAKGHESGGWVGEETSFVLLQRLLSVPHPPVWVQGGIGLHSVAAAYVAGAAGAVLDSQLLLTSETPLEEGTRARLAQMDGSETVCLGQPFEARFRCYARNDLSPAGSLRQLETSLVVGDLPATAAGESWRATVRSRVDWRDPSATLLAVGQDAAFADELARRFGSVGGVLAGLEASIRQHCAAARRSDLLGEGAPLARSHGTRYPIVQGPMTRVSDRAEFAAAVAEAGALPFLALALMRAPEVETLLEETRRALGDRPWGVGILGFVPPELRAEQLEVIRAHPPAFALIAGGRPDQARALEQVGSATYLHVPSPGLLELYLAEGASRFVFEGRECGGHVGPRTSFVLWDAVIRLLLDKLPPGRDPGEYHVLFAGGIHDGLSAAMVAVMAAPLAERGVKVGVLMGTAYLFTEEAVRCGAISPDFQAVAAGCDRTVLVESGVGHATRCAPSPFVQEFEAEKRRLLALELPSEQVRARLEELNIGRLRIAAKGQDRDPRFGEDPTAPKLVALDAEAQRARGMYMIGQVAALRDRVGSVAELHADVAASRRSLPAELPVVAGEHTPPPAAVAIVGIGTILPGAPNVRAFWANIMNGVDAIGEVPASRWDWRQYYDPDRAARDRIYSRWGGFIDDVPFDPVEFGMPPSSLASIEPFQLLALAIVRDALRDAGYLDRPFPRERTSVMLGAGGGGADLTAGYMFRSSLQGVFGQSAPELADRLKGALPEWTEDSFAGILMNVSAGRIANRFDFGGLNYTVDAACASSLAAVYLGVRELEAHTSDVVVVGGVDAIQNPFAYLCFSKTQALSPSGRCRPFDAQADGIAISEGFAAVILKRLADAERDGDRIYAVIRGVGGASDGRDRSLTAPRPEGQMRAVRRAYAQAGISPTTIGLVEAHGTGTVAGDQAEIEALTTVFAEAGAASGRCAIGSVKSMIGHTKATAGVAGLVKAALALHHRVLPPTIGVTEPNPKANFPASPFYVNTEARPWVSGDTDQPRRAGVSAFGFGGTDFHILLEEYAGGYRPDRSVGLESWPAELFLWRGRSRAEIGAEVARLATKLAAGARPNPTDLAYTLAQRASALPVGAPALAIVATSIDDLQEKLVAARTLLEGGEARHHLPSGIHFAEQPLAGQGEVAFLFPGQGSQAVNMVRDLALVFPEVRESFDRADRALGERLERPLSEYIFPRPVFVADEARRQQTELTETNVAQPALGAAALALRELLGELGVEPTMVAGHSYGEFVALATAGCFDDATLLRLSEARGRFMREGVGEESGTMAAVDAAPEALAPLLADPGVTLANLNAPTQTVISGARASVERALEWCAASGLRARLLPVACAFHSPLVAPAQRRLAEQLRATAIGRPRIPVFSNTTAAPYPSEPEGIVDLLGEHMVRPVEFVRQIEAMHQAGARLFVEVGPRNVLSGLVQRILDGRPHLCVPLDQPGRPGLVQLLHALAGLTVEGVPVALERLFQRRSARLLDLSALEAQTGQPTYSRTTWLVNGGHARPLGRPADEHLRPLPVAIQVDSPAAPASAAPPELEAPAPQALGAATDAGTFDRPAVRATPAAASTNGSASRAPATPAAPRYPAAEPGLPTKSKPTAIVNGAAMTISLHGHPRQSGADETMDRFQQVMQHFLETQRAVMLSYLGNPRLAGAEPNATRSHAADAHLLDRPPAPRASALAALAPAPPAHPVGPLERDEAGHREGTPSHGPVNGASDGGAPNGRADDGLAVVLAPPRAPEPAIPPAAPAVVPAVAPTGSPDGGAADRLTREQLTERLLAIVSERTGYPTEMLTLEADLEADLGIDSIKRVEIAGSMLQSLPGGAEPPDVERLTASRTLRAVIDALEASYAATPAATGARGPFEFAVGETTRIGRFLVRSAPAAEISRAANLGEGVVLIVDDGTGVGAALANLLGRAGRSALRVVAAGDEGPDAVAADLTDPGQVRSLVETVHRRRGPVSALVHLPALRSSSADVSLDVPGWRDRLRAELTSLFLIAQALRDDLERAAEAGGAAVLVATALGGAFATDPTDWAFFPGSAGLAGFVKTLAFEWPTVRAKVVDVAAASPVEVAGWLLAELMADDGLVEVGYRAGCRQSLELVPAERSVAASATLDEESVLLVTGGARGITAEVALRLAGAYRPRIVLVGRTALPDAAEAAATAGLTDPPALRRAIIEALRRRGEPVAAGPVEEAFRRLLREREVRENAARLRETGAPVEHVACDVSDEAAFGAVIDDLYRRYGRIDGVIHGAGVIEDRLVRDKDLASFERVLATKVVSTLVLATRLRPEQLRFLVLFSSVSGRFGNRGQGDYAAASEVLNKTAQWLDRRWPGRVVAINWGPWLTTGMVSPEVQRQFAERGVELIPPEVGCRRLDEELRGGLKGEVEVLIGGGRGPAVLRPSARPAGTESVAGRGGPLLATATALRDGEGGLVLARSLDPAHDIYLRDHQLDGRPVLPFAVALELIAECAAVARPDLEVAAVRDIRVLRGITFERGAEAMQVRAHPSVDRGDGRPITLDLVVGSGDDPARARYRAAVELRPRGAPEERVLAPEDDAFLVGAGPLPGSLPDLYRAWLFHGPLFQGIVSVEAIGPHGARATLRTSSPADCLADRPDADWLIDPVMVDSAFQMQVIWARMHWDVTLLPARVGAYERLATEPASGPVRLEMRLRPESQTPLCRFDHYFFDSQGCLLGRLVDVEGVGNRALNRLATGSGA